MSFEDSENRTTMSKVEGGFTEVSELCSVNDNSKNADEAASTQKSDMSAFIPSQENLPDSTGGRHPALGVIDGDSGNGFSTSDNSLEVSGSGRAAGFEESLENVPCSSSTEKPKSLACEDTVDLHSTVPNIASILGVNEFRMPSLDDLKKPDADSLSGQHSAIDGSKYELKCERQKTEKEEGELSEEEEDNHQDSSTSDNIVDSLSNRLPDQSPPDSSDEVTESQSDTPITYESNDQVSSSFRESLLYEKLRKPSASMVSPSCSTTSLTEASPVCDDEVFRNGPTLSKQISSPAVSCSDGFLMEDLNLRHADSIEDGKNYDLALSPNSANPGGKKKVSTVLMISLVMFITVVLFILTA